MIKEDIHLLIDTYEPGDRIVILKPHINLHVDYNYLYEAIAITILYAGIEYYRTKAVWKHKNYTWSWHKDNLLM